MIGASNQSIWQRCAKALGHPEWAEDSRFAMPSDRRAHRDELGELLEAVLGTKPTAHWIEVLDAAAVPCGPVNNYEQLFNDPQVKHREMVVHVQDEELGSVPHIRSPLRLSETFVGVRHTAPKLGQHNQEILSGLGLSDTEIAALREKQVI